MSCWQHCTERCAERWPQIMPKSEVTYHYYNHGLVMSKSLPLLKIYSFY
ncbi:hypothetical protein Gotur_007297 [Gossypium turneri]